MSQQSPPDITQMLIEMTDGNTEAVNQILPHIYGELRKLASSYLRRERSNHTLQPTALVNEAYLKLVDQKKVVWQNRAHFFGIAAQVMRRILLDHARKHTAEKRGGDAELLPIEEEILIVSHEKSAELIALDEALENLAKIDEQKARIVELRYFGGLSIEETAEVMGVSVPTINRQWRMAKAWLYGQVAKEG
jgi:RNA polymerase sigma factor (TIGR02999 family)